MAKVFFGYPELPLKIGEVCRTAAARIAKFDGITVETWQDHEVGGRVVMNEVLDSIESADMCVFDLTQLNPNVLFEVGFAIARAKLIWLTIDTTVSTALSDWNRLGVLTPLGFTSYKNSGELAQKFFDADPTTTLVPVYDQIIEPSFDEDGRRSSLLYCPTFEPFEASSRLSTLVEERRRRGLAVTVSDPTESSLDPLTWYAPKLQAAAGVLVSFAGPGRNNAKIHNLRHALIAGLAVGFEIPLLMLAEEDYSPPFDYKDRLTVYETAEECTAVARRWLDRLRVEGISWSRPRAELRSALFGLRFGEHVAENEYAELNDYFVETAAYGAVVAARDSIFVGHRGTGKTANALQAFDEIARNKTNLAVLVKPPGFEFPGLLAAVARIPNHQHDYLFDTLWRFVVQTEIAAAALFRIEARAPGVPADAAEEAFLKYVDSAPFRVRADISVRLEQALNHLLSATEVPSVTAESTRDLINEAFHDKALAELRHQLGPVLRDRKRVAVFIDNLDKGWEARADLNVLARLILGLLTARGRLVTDFKKSDSWRDEIQLTIAIFLRSDIYNYLKTQAREPDKLPLETIEWRDPETLLTVIESRFLAGRSDTEDAGDLWTKYFCPTVDGVPTRQFVCDAVLPRPRDIVYFCNAAVGRAIDRRHDQVLEEDFKAAVDTYSTYAYEALLVENGITIPEMTEALLSLLGSPVVQPRSVVLAGLKASGLPDDRCEPVLAKLISMSVLGLETDTDIFDYPEVGSQMERAAAYANRVQPDIARQRLRLHQAFWSFLGATN